MIMNDNRFGEMRYISTVLLVVMTLCLNAQTSFIPPLERKVTVNAENETVESILNNITSQTGILFSYNPGVINSQKTVICQAENKPVRLVLASILDNSVTCKTRGKYIILKNNENDKLQLEGYLYDSQTGERISFATVYEKTLMASAITDQYGHFSIDLPPVATPTSLQISKTGYTDTSIISIYRNDKIRPLEVAMSANSKDSGKKPSFLSGLIPYWLIPDNIRINSINISETWPKTLQISLVPGLSTNKLLGGNIENKFSVNILGGYTKSVGYIELGGVFNVVENNAGFCQIGGISNFVGGDSKGLQMAGIYNASFSVDGVQIGGLINSAREKADIQLAGIMNKTADSKLQISGIANLAEKTGRIQVSGIVNVADSADIQIGGIINRARYARTLQISLVNIADTSAGFVIGLLNIVKHGYHKIEFSTDEALHANIAFRSGTKKIHGIITTGMATFGPAKQAFGVGYGVGTTLGKSVKTTFDIDLSSTTIFYRDDFSCENMLHKFYAGIDRKLTDKFSLAGGLTLNLLITDTQSKYYNNVYSDISPYSFVNKKVGEDHNYKCWIGAKLALRIL